MVYVEQLASSASPDSAVTVYQPPAGIPRKRNDRKYTEVQGLEMKCGRAKTNLHVHPLPSSPTGSLSSAFFELPWVQGPDIVQGTKSVHNVLLSLPTMR